MKTEIFENAGFDKPIYGNTAINSEDVSNAVLYLLSTPYHLNITELTLKVRKNIKVTSQLKYLFQHVSQKF